jgi:hypothetical protein
MQGASLPAPLSNGRYSLPPTLSGQPGTLDFSQAPAALNAFMGKYDGVFQTNVQGDQEEVPFTLTLARQQSTSSGSVGAYATFKLELRPAPSTPLETLEGYLGIDPNPVITGSTYFLATTAFESRHLALAPISIRMLLAVQPGTNQFHPQGSLVGVFDCGYSMAGVCADPSSEASIKSIRKTE